jgi:hypothetical protein
MPFAVTHVLIAIIIAELIRDYLVKDKRKFPLHYVLIAGIVGLLPDIDVPFMLLQGYPLSTALRGATNMHPSFTHSILWIPITLALAFLFLWLEKKNKIPSLEKLFRKHRITISGVLFIAALGLTIHLALDVTLSGYLRIGFFTEPIGLNLIPLTAAGTVLTEGIDAALLILWLIHEELRHRISRFL